MIPIYHFRQSLSTWKNWFDIYVPLLPQKNNCSIIIELVNSLYNSSLCFIPYIYTFGHTNMLKSQFIYRKEGRRILKPKLIEQVIIYPYVIYPSNDPLFLFNWWFLPLLKLPPPPHFSIIMLITYLIICTNGLLSSYTAHISPILIMISNIAQIFLFF